MKKGKFKLLLTAFLAASTLFVGCGKTSNDTPKESNNTTENQQSTDDKLNVAILLNGTLGDKAFFDSAANGGEMMKKEIGADVKVVEMTYDETKWLPTLIDYSEDKDTDIIIVGTWQMVEKLQEIAPQYPDKKYIIFDSSVDYTVADLSNVYSIEYKQNECSYLVGAAASLTTKTGTIGMVGGMENYVINDFLLGYIQGAKDVKDDIKISIAYVGNFSDSAKAKELALAQMNQGADIVYQVASTAGIGVIDAAAEKGKFAIGVDSDQAEAFLETDPAKAESILTSALKRVDISLARAVKLASEDKLNWGNKEVLGIAEECVGIAKNEIFTKNATPETVAKVIELEKGILDGSIKVDTAFGKTTNEIEEIRASVRP